MTETTRVLLAAESLAERGFLAREVDRRLIDLAVEDRGFRYRTAFWQRVGALVSEADGSVWRSPLEGASDLTEAQLRIAVEWAAVGAPLDWARGEARTALEGFLRRFMPRTWSGTRGPSAEDGSSAAARVGSEEPLSATRRIDPVRA